MVKVREEEANTKKASQKIAEQAQKLAEEKWAVQKQEAAAKWEIEKEEATARKGSHQIEKEWWMFEKEEAKAKQEETQLNFSVNLMKQYKEMKTLGFTDETILQMVPAMKKLIDALK